MANQGSTPQLWLAWSGLMATLAGVMAVPALAGPREPWWADARIEVFTYPITLFAVTCGVGSLALRERLVRAVSSGTLDPHSAEGGGRVRSVLLRAWALCVAVAIFGAFIAWVAADPRRAWPYAVGAAALLAFHAPRPVVPRPS
jgi:hypothetical protein